MIPCNFIIKSGPRKQKKCGRNNCHFYSHQSIFRYLKIDISQNFVELFSSYEHKKFIEVFTLYQNFIQERDELIYLEDFRSNIFTYFMETAMDCIILSKKHLIIVLLFLYLDLPGVHEIMMKHSEKFMRISRKKFEELFCSNHVELSLSNFIHEHFELNKRFFTKRMNKQYKIRIFRGFMFSLSAFWKLHVYTIHKRYQPGGIGYYEAKNEFDSLVKNHV